MDPRHKKSYMIISVLAVVFLVGFLIYIFIFSGISADEKQNRGEFVDQIGISYDLDDDKKEESVYLDTYQKSNDKLFYVKIAESPFANSEVELFGFESDASFCVEPIISFSDTSLVCISGYVGAHSQNIVLVGYDGDTEKMTFEKDGTVSDRVYSDVPNFGLEDMDDDGNKEFFVDHRDYDKNPLVDFIRSYYYLEDTTFVYGGSQSMRSDNLNSGGKIN